MLGSKHHAYTHPSYNNLSTKNPLLKGVEALLVSLELVLRVKKFTHDNVKFISRLEDMNKLTSGTIPVRMYIYLLALLSVS